MSDRTLADIRVDIDSVDRQIRELFIKRMQLSKQVAEVKAQTADTIYKPDRETAIIEKQSKDMDSDTVMEYKALIKRIMEVSRKYQYGITLQLRDCFPFSFETELSAPEHIVMLRSELFACDFASKDTVDTVESYEAICDSLKSGRADAGVGVIEHIGRGVSDPLNTLLLGHSFFINDCHVTRYSDGKRKVVLFSDKLVVRPEHNRLKLVFVAPNRSGALSSILSMISDYGVNLTEIHSIPYHEGENWNYRFFVELNTNLLDTKAQALIYQLSQETLQLQLLGSYLCEGDFNELS